MEGQGMPPLARVSQFFRELGNHLAAIPEDLRTIGRVARGALRNYGQWRGEAPQGHPPIVNLQQMGPDNE